MINKNILVEYADLQQACKELRDEIYSMEFRCSRREILKKYKDILEELEQLLLVKLGQVEEYIESIKDEYLQQIISLKVIEGLTWKQITEYINVGNCAEELKIRFDEFISG